MGKVLIIGIFVISAIFIIIILSVQSETGNSREGISRNLTEIQAKALCREALNYGIKKVKDAGSSATLPSYTQPFVDFEIGDGIIDSIEYIAIGDTMKISSYATYQNVNNTFQHKSTAFVTWALATGSAAITANGAINQGGSATITGGTLPYLNPPLDFEEFFGMTKDYMRDNEADWVLENYPAVMNPDPDPDSLWISGTTYVTTGELRVTRTDWDGEGILVVEGDANFNGGSFRGVMWITGSLIVTGNENFSGAIYVEGIDPLGGEATAVPILGDCTITYDASVILSVMGNIGQVLSYELKVLSIFEDD